MIFSGHVKVYRREFDGLNGVTWEQLGRNIVGEAPYDGTGYSLSLASNGKRQSLAIGSYWNDGNGEDAGQVRVFHFDENSNLRTWEQLGEDIDGDGPGDLLGYSTDISMNNNNEMLVLVGAPGYWEEADRPGYAQIYHAQGYDSSLSWKQLGQTIYGESKGDQFGCSVSFSPTGDTVAIGANYNDGNGYASGHVRVYIWDGSKGVSNSTWKQLGQDIDGEAEEEYSGMSVTLGAGGKSVAIGSPRTAFNGEGSGSVRIFDIGYGEGAAK